MICANEIFAKHFGQKSFESSAVAGILGLWQQKIDRFCRLLGLICFAGSEKLVYLVCVAQGKFVSVLDPRSTTITIIFSIGAHQTSYAFAMIISCAGVILILELLNA